MQTSSPRVENQSPQVDTVKSVAKTQTSNKEKKNRDANFPRFENPSPRVDIVKSDAKTQTSNKEKKKEKKKKKTKKQTSHHQSLIRCKRCEIPCYYQQLDI